MRIGPSLRVIALALLQVPQAAALSFSVQKMKGEPIIVAKGTISSGDDRRLKAHLIARNRHSAGYFAMLLDSPGGDVEAAFALSRLMDGYPINTYVAAGARCVSACAAIVFIAGREHVALPGALLGFHGCFDIGTREINEACNERIAMHALEHGTAYGSVMAFIENIKPDRTIWLDGRDADCWAINRYQISPQPEGYEQCVFEAIRRVVRK